MKIVTAHFEDGTTQDFKCPDWAEWIEYDFGLSVSAWDREPVIKAYGFFDPHQPNGARYKDIGMMHKNQSKGHTLTLHKIEEE